MDAALVTDCMQQGIRNQGPIVQTSDRVVVVITKSRFKAARSASGPGTSLTTKAAPLLTIPAGARKIRQRDDQTCFSFSVAPPTGHGLFLSAEHMDPLTSRKLQLGHENESCKMLDFSLRLSSKGNLWRSNHLIECNSVGRGQSQLEPPWA
jgi:hypothetical protein